MGMLNKVIGYLYLVDEFCRIRWAGVGFPEQREIEALDTCIAVLLDRLKEAASNSEDKSQGACKD